MSIDIDILDSIGAKLFVFSTLTIIFLTIISIVLYRIDGRIKETNDWISKIHKKLERQDKS